MLICSSPEAPFSGVVVEGGPKAVKRFRGLMCRRIDWADAAQLQAESERQARNWCADVWGGSVVRRCFQGFRFQECKSTLTARRVLEAKGCAHYWDAAVQAHDKGPPKVEEEDEDE